jgi:hypothetical protein
MGWLTKLAQAGRTGKAWLRPVCVPDKSFDFESAVASSIEWEEMFGYLDSGGVGIGLFSASPLTSPEPTPPPSPAQKPAFSDSQDPPSISPLSPPEPWLTPDDSPSTATEPPAVVNAAQRKYRSNKARSHARRKRQRTDERMEREAGGQPYDVRAPTRLKHVRPSNAVNARLNLGDVPISAPGYIGLRDKKDEKDRTQYKLEDVVGEHSKFRFKLLKWDGR